MGGPAVIFITPFAFDTRAGFSSKMPRDKILPAEHLCKVFVISRSTVPLGGASAGRQALPAKDDVFAQWPDTR
eukprot:m.230882 g.230882  ORF g.230882 m.230882 type:complete len:73 (-) comp18861_c0_seq3:812-1030(-)